MAKPVYHDLYCYKGQTYEQNLYFKQNKQPIDLTGITFRSQIRPAENSPVLVAEFDVVTDAEIGKVSLNLTAEQTSAIRDSAYFWDLKATDESDIVKYWVRGKFIVSGRVTE